MCGSVTDSYRNSRLLDQMTIVIGKPVMKNQSREVNTCDRCRSSKRRCDRVKPVCSRCHHAGVHCSFESLPSPSPSASSSSDAVSPPDITIPLRIQSLDNSANHESDPRGLIKSSANVSASPAEPSNENNPVIVRKRRNRACLSCVRCHKLKVKCDKKVPCSRCLGARAQSTCTYAQNKAAKSTYGYTNVGSGPGSDEDSRQVVAAWNSRYRGSSHWKALLLQVNILDPALIPRPGIF